MKNWKFELEQTVKIECSGEKGEVIGRAEYPADEDRFLVRYKGGDGCAREAWWPASALA